MKRKIKAPWYQIKALDGAKVEVRIFGEIGWEVTAAKFVEDLDAIGDRDLDVRINSGGGSVVEGIHIYNRLLMHKGHVTVLIEGIAASMASVIAMAGNHVSMLEAGWMMIHNPSGMTWGEADDHRKAAEVLDQMKDTLIDAYSKKSGLGRDEIAEMMDEETWLSPADALEKGFIDEILEIDLDMAACLEEVDLSKFGNVPAVLGESVTTEPPGSKSKPAASAATQVGVSIMTPEEKAAIEAAKEKERQAILEEGRKAEVNRRNSITAVFKGFEGHETVMNACLEDPQCTEDQARVKLLDSVKAKNGDVEPHGRVVVTEDVRDKHRNAAVAVLLARSNYVDESDGRVVQVAGDNPFRGARMIDIARDCLVDTGRSVRGMSPLELVSAAITHSTSDFPNILQDAMHKMLLNGFNTAGDTWSRFCKTGDLADFRPHYRHIAGSFSDLLALNENGEIKDGTLDDSRKETITGTTKARILNLSRQTIVNDDMSVFSDVARQLGRSARRAVEIDVYALLALNSDFGPAMADTVTLFHANHNNVSTGAPSTTSIAAAVNVLRSMKLPNASTAVDEFIDPTMPPVFVGPLGLAQDAKVINESQYNHDSTKLNQPNKSRGLLSDIVGTPRRTGLPWFLFPNPAEIPVIEVGFVGGVQEPQMEMQESFRQYGVSWRVVYDYGVAAVSYYAVRSTGA